MGARPGNILPLVPVPAPGFERNPGAMPNSGETLLQVQFACGYVCKWPYKARDLKWRLTGHAFDVGAIREFPQ